MSWARTALSNLALTEKGAIVSGPFGSNIGKRFFVESGVPVIRGNNLSMGCIEFVDAGFVFLTDDKAAEFKNCEAVSGDLIFTAAGTIGQTGIIPKKSAYEKYIISNKQLRARLDPRKANSKFVYYWLKTKEMIDYIIQRNTGSSIPLINLTILRNIPVPVPPLAVQDQIVTFLNNYDDLIETNRRRIALLEESARLLYREWFVNLRFPGHEQAAVIDGLPPGWVKAPLGDLAFIVMGQSPESKFYNHDGNGLPFHQGVTGFGEHFVSHNTYTTQTTRIAEAGDILCSVRAPVGRLNLTLDKIAIGRGLSAMRSRTGQQSLLLYQLKALFVEEDMIGGGAIFASVTKKELFAQQLLQPDLETAAEFNRLAGEIDEQIETLVMQNRLLFEARDKLLPKLMSGAIQV